MAAKDSSVQAEKARYNISASKGAKEKPYDPRDHHGGHDALYGPGAGPTAASRAVTAGGGRQTGARVDTEALRDHIRSADERVTERIQNLHYFPVSVGGLELKLEPLSPSIGTVVHGIDLSAPLAPEVVAFLRQLWLDRRVIFFRNQQLSREQHVAFSVQFGDKGGVYGEHRPGEGDGLAKFLSNEKGTGAASR
jgi:hypothetical protein